MFVFALVCLLVIKITDEISQKSANQKLKYLLI